jgi:predicted permease
VRQFLAESLVLGMASIPAAILLAMWSLDINKRSMPAEIEIHLPGWRTIGVDIHALSFGIGAALLTSIVAGLLPAWIGSGADLTSQLKEGGRSMAGGIGKNRVRSTLVVIQVTLSMVLIAGSALMYRGAGGLAKAAPGRNPEQVLAASVLLPDKKYPTAQRQGEFAQRMLEAARAVPGAEAAALISDVPYESDWNTIHVETDALPATLQRTWNQLPEVEIQRSSSGYFSLMGISLKAGRDIADGDGPDTRQVAVISQLTAKLLYRDSNPIGQRFRFETGPWITVVGVCGDALQTWVLRQPLPTIYRPFRQMGGAKISALIRSTRRTPEAIAADWRSAVQRLDPDLPLFRVDSQERVIDLELSGLHYLIGMLGASGLISLLLAAVGVYSLMSFTATERTREVGIRMALGAKPGEVVGMLVGQGLRMVGVGLAFGLVGAVGISRIFENLIFGVHAFDPISLGLGAILFT